MLCSAVLSSCVPQVLKSRTLAGPRPAVAQAQCLLFCQNTNPIQSHSKYKTSKIQSETQVLKGPFSALGLGEPGIYMNTIATIFAGDKSVICITYLGYNYNTKTTFVSRLHNCDCKHVKCVFLSSISHVSLCCIIVFGQYRHRQCLQLPRYLLGTVLLSVQALTRQQCSPAFRSGGV